MRDSSSIDFDPDYVPGSEYIFASSFENSELLLKDKDIVLVPQPTASPNDPLNWPKWRRMMQICIILFIRGVTTAVADDAFSIVLGVEQVHPELTVDTFSNSAGVLFVGIGCWAALNAPSAYLWGSRISYIASAIFGIIGNALFSQVSSPSVLYLSQFCTGAAAAVGETVAILSFAQLCFQHQMNDVIGLYVLSTSAGNFAGPLIDGYVSENLGWRWVGYFGVIFECVTLALVIFGMEETYFDRAHFESRPEMVIEGIMPSTSNSEGPNKEKLDASIHGSPSKQASGTTAEASKNSTELHIAPQLTHNVVLNGGLSLHEPKQSVEDVPKTYWQRIRFITPATNLRGWGFKQYFKRLVLLTRVFLFPPVVFAGFQWAIQLGFTGIYKNLETSKWAGPPWNYGSGPIALMMMPNLIGATIGALYSTWGADFYVRYMARRNNGLHEAETRLWLLFPALILYPLGLILFGVGTHYKWSWPPVYVGLGFVGFGFGSAGEISIAYMTDCYPGMVLESMVGLVFIYTMSSIVISFSTKDWLTTGDLNSMIICACIGFVILGSFIPMAVFGKRMRKKTRRMYFSFIAMRDSLNQG